ncbi:MAG TPA: DNA-binding transcriptional regulator, partial [Tepidisphaeraceae bacterium]
TEFAYARGVLRGIIAATRARNLYADEVPRRTRHKDSPWLFRVYRGIYGHSSKYLAKWFKDWEPDGIICQIYDDRLAKVYRETGKPVVELFESRGKSEFPRVLPDDTATGAMAAQHFIERGFRHFAFFGAPWMLWSHERQQGFEAEIGRAFAARAANHRVADSTFTFTASGADERVLRGPQRRRGAAMGTWLKSLPRPLAVFVANDSWGFELVQAAREVGLHVPAEVAILGVDNEELLCEIAYPPLSSIRMGSEQIGHAAVATLERMLLGLPPATEVSRVPPLDVVTRQSTDILAVEDADVAAALRYIREHAAGGLSVKQLLGEITVNRRTLERRFVSLLGHTPLEEIHRVRLERVKALLQTDMPIYEVASRCGFSTPEHMATSFLRMAGQTPTAFRQQCMPQVRWQRLLPSI